MEVPKILPNNVEAVPDENSSQGGVEEDEFPKTFWECKKMVRKYLCETTVLNNAETTRTRESDMKNPRGNRNSSGSMDLCQDGQNKSLRSCLRQCPPGEVNSYIGTEAPSLFNQQPLPVVPYPPRFPVFSNNGGQGQFYQSGLYPVARFLNDPSQGAPLVQRQYFHAGPLTNQEVPGNVFGYPDSRPTQNIPYLQNPYQTLYPVKEILQFEPVHPKPDFVGMKQQFQSTLKPQQRCVPQKYCRPEPETQTQERLYHPRTPFQNNEPLHHQIYGQEENNCFIPDNDLTFRYFMEGDAQTQKAKLATATSQTYSHDTDRGIQTLTPPGQHGGYQTANPAYSSEFVQTPEARRDLKLTQTGIPDESFPTTQTTNVDNQMITSGRGNSLGGDAARDVKTLEESQRTSIVESALSLQQRPPEINSTNDLATRTKSTVKPHNLNDITRDDRIYASKNSPMFCPDAPTRTCQNWNLEPQRVGLQQNQEAERMLAQQNPYTNQMLAQQNPYLNQMTLQQNPFPNQMTAQQNPYPNQMLAQQNPYPNQMTVQQNSYPNQMTAHQNPYPNQMLAQQNPYPNHMLAQQNSYPKRIPPQQNEDPDVLAQINKNCSPYKNNILKSQSSPGLLKEGFNQLPMSQLNPSPPAPQLPTPQLQDHRSSLKTVEAEPNKPLNAPKQGFDSQLLNCPYPHSRPPACPSIIINLTTAPCGPKCSCVPCCDSIQMWEQVPKPVYPTSQMMPIPNYLDFPAGVPYHTGGAQNLGNMPNVGAHFTWKSYGLPRNTTAENYGGKSTLELNYLSSLEQDLLKTSRKDQSDTSSSMAYDISVSGKNKNGREAEDFTSNTAKNIGQTALVPKNGNPNPNLRSHHSAWSSHPSGQKYPAIRSDFPPNPYNQAALLVSANGNDCNIPNQRCCANANACAVEEKRLCLNRPHGNARKIIQNKVREPSCYPLRFENDRFKMDAMAMDEAEFQNLKLRPKCGRKFRGSICKCKGVAPPRNSMRYILVEDEDQE